MGSRGGERERGEKKSGREEGREREESLGGLLLLGYEGGVSRVLWVHSMVNLKLKSRN